MARLWSCGFELNSTLGGMEVSATSNFSVQSTTVRSGGFAGQTVNLVSGVARGFVEQFIAAAGNGPFFTRKYVRFATFPSAENRIMGLNDTLALAGTDVYITADNGGLLRLYDEDGVIGSPSSALSLNVWYAVGFQYDRTPAAGSQVVRARLDDTEFAGAATRNLSVAALCLVCGGNLALEAQTVGSWFWDDFAINDGTGSIQTSFPDEQEVIHQRPNAVGDNNVWARGGTDSGANWSQVEENPPNDVTDYVQSNTAGQIDDYNCEATPAALASDDVINVVQVGVRCAVDVATGADPDIVLRIEASALGTIEESPAIDVNSTTWRTNNAGAVLNYLLTLYDKPGAPADAWTKADLDTMQIGQRESVSDTHFARVTAVWALVSHKPAPPAGAELPLTTAMTLTGAGH